MENIAVVILSSSVVSAIITTFLAFFTNRKKDTLENIVKERKIWRDELKTIANSIAKSKNLEQLKIEISKLKVRINPYGMGTNSIFRDSHIWEQIRQLEKYEKITKDDLEKNKIIFVNLISCLLKFDWERAKNEIKGNIQTNLVIVSLISCYILYSIKWFWDYNSGSEKIINYISDCIMYSIFMAFSLLIIYLVDKWKNKAQLYFIIFTTITVSVIILLACYVFLPNWGLNWNIGTVILLIPILTFIYSAETKLFFYMNNVRYFLLASASSIGTNKIDIQYKIFFEFAGKKISEFPTGEKIIFVD